ncbi:MAG TPA: tetratricopeptide repeat protein [Terriglobales bacterium]|jgi:tetratricopeptide (TPR) repeat protein|nr:tetratricopeptide repeat protein [Terriglobales bacterium]
MNRALSLLIGFLVVSAIYLYAFPQANVVYAGVVLLHAFAGVVAAVWLLLWLLRSRFLRQSEPLVRVGMGVLFLGAIPGLALIYTGTLRTEWTLVYVHIGVSFLGAGLIAAARYHEWLPRHAPIRVVAVLAVIAVLAPVARYLRETRWNQRSRIENPAMPPLTMNGEGDGPNGPFFPSSAQVYGGEKIPSQFFMESDSCKRCHEDIYNQWNSSAHHFSSFNNQWYRKAIEYMQDTIGTKPSKWCGGCHDPAVLYAGKMDTPIKQFVHAPEAQAGLGCMMCHSIADVKSTMGQGDFYLEYPKLHELAASKNPLVRTVHDFMIKLNPEPHRRVFLKPFMKQQTAEFCSSCHKVHLDVPVNHYRWIRGFNEYDNWQASGVSGEGARSFYYPAKPQQCADCHMPLERSNDMGNIAGKVHSHRFPAANTALPTANEDAAQLKATEDFLTSGALTVDIFALSPASAPLKTGAVAEHELATTFAVGEEAETKITPGAAGAAAPVTAPLNRVQPAVRRGDTVRVDVVVRTKRVGHFFPGGTVDAYDTWLELKGVDDQGQTIFWSGMVEDNGKGPVEKGAHFYRSLQVDAHGNPINKRNAWATRAVVYVRLIPPGAADTVHFRMKVPEKTGGKIALTARLCYRKFSWFNTQFAFAGERDNGLTGSGAVPASVTPDYDDTRMTFTASLHGVSAKSERIPDLPIVAVAENEVTVDVLPANAPMPQPKTQLAKEDWQRWNDYGIGLLLQGDLKAAQAAFEKVTEVDPQNPDGWVNIGRAALQEGDVARARTVLEKALALSPDLARAHFFYAGVLRQEGNYDGAAQHLTRVLAQYPRDRVALNNLGRVFFLQRKYADAVNVLQQVLAVDPEDLQAHYNLMLCYNGLGDGKMSKEHQARYLRFKADEAAQAITGPYRQLNPEDNNERQSIHEHVSIPLPILNNAPAKRLTASVITNHVATAAPSASSGQALGRSVGQSPATVHVATTPGAQR